MRTRTIFATVALAALLVPGQSHASPQTKRYVAGPGYTIVNPRSEAPGINGVGFVPNVDPTKLKVTDAVGAGKVLFKVCQPSCGSAVVRQAYCVKSGTTVTLPTTLNGTDPILVFVYTEETVNTLWVGNISCPDAVGTTGEVTLT